MSTQPNPRRFFVGGNWKANGTVASVAALIAALNSAVPRLPDVDHAEVVVAPTLLHLAQAQATLRSRFALAAQDCHVSDGAFTGEVSAVALADAGVKWVILGHSERRHVFGESDELLGKKIAAALAAGLHVIFCVGELERERDEGRTNAVLVAQLKALVGAAPPLDWSRVVIAYEPVWAIGTGKNATPAMAQETHAFLRSHLALALGADAAARTRILYGGSVKANNCVELAACADVDGFLVGGASLLADQFEAIIKARSAKL